MDNVLDPIYATLRSVIISQIGDDLSDYHGHPSVLQLPIVHSKPTYPYVTLSRPTVRDAAGDTTYSTINNDGKTEYSTHKEALITIVVKSEENSYELINKVRRNFLNHSVLDQIYSDAEITITRASDVRERFDILSDRVVPYNEFNLFVRFVDRWVDEDSSPIEHIVTPDIDLPTQSPPLVVPIEGSWSEGVWDDSGLWLDDQIWGA